MKGTLVSGQNASQQGVISKYLLLNDDESINSLTQVSQSYFIANTHSFPSVLLPWRRRSKTVLPYASQILPCQNSTHPNWNLKTLGKLKVATPWKMEEPLLWPMGYIYLLDIVVLHLLVLIRNLSAIMLLRASR